MRCHLVALASLILVTGCSPEVRKETTYEIRFGIIGVGANGESRVIRETNQIPRRDQSTGFRYGISIVPSDDRPFEIYFVAGFPSLPERTSGLAKDAPINPITQKLKSPSQTGKGVSTVPFWFDPGDPLGKYTLEIFINGQSRKYFEYNVVE